MKINPEDLRNYSTLFSQKNARQIAQVIGQNAYSGPILREIAKKALGAALLNSHALPKELGILQEKLTAIENALYTLQAKGTEVDVLAQGHLQKLGDAAGQETKVESERKGEGEGSAVAKPSSSASKLGVKVEDCLRQAIAEIEQGRKCEKGASSPVYSAPPLDISKHSLLQKPISKNVLESIPQLTNRLFAHLHGDPFLEATGLEGNSWENSVAYLHDFFQYADPKAEITAQLAICREACAIVFAPLAEDGTYEKHLRNVHKRYQAFLSEKLAALAPGKSLLLPGGWGGAPPGHVMYYQIISQAHLPKGSASTEEARDAPPLFTFKAFNTGAGIETYHPHPINVGNGKELYAPYKAWQDVKLENLLRPAFIGSMIEVLVCEEETLFSDGQKQIRPIRYSSRDIYEGVLVYLEGTPGEALDLNIHQTAQHSGTCSWSGLMAFARQALAPRAFAALQYRLGIDSLVAFHLKHRGHLHESAETLLLLEKSLAAFAHQMLEHYSAGLLEEADMQTIYATLEEIRQPLIAAKRLYMESHTLDAQAIMPASLPTTFGELSRLHTAPFESLSLTATGSDALAVLATLLATPIPLDAPPESLVSLLQNFYGAAAQAYQAGQCDLVSCAIAQLFEKLPDFEFACPAIDDCLKAICFEHGLGPPVPAVKAEVDTPGKKFWRALTEELRLHSMQLMVQLSEILLQASLSSTKQAHLGQHLAVVKAQRILIALSLQSKNLGSHYQILFRDHLVSPSTASYNTGIPFSCDKLKNRAYLQNNYLTCSISMGLNKSLELNLNPGREADSFEINPVTHAYADRADFKLMSAYLSVEENLKKFLAVYPHLAGQPSHIQVAFALHANDQSVLPPEFCLVKRQIGVAQFITQKDQLNLEEDERERIKAHDPEKGAPLFPVEVRDCIASNGKVYFSRSGYTTSDTNRRACLDARLLASPLSALGGEHISMTADIDHMEELKSEDLDRLEKKWQKFHAEHPAFFQNKAEWFDLATALSGTSSAEFCVQKILAFFTKYRKNLESVDFQCFLKTHLCTHLIMRDFSGQGMEMAEAHLKLFLDKQCATFKAEKNILVCCFLLGLGQLFAFESADGATLRAKLDDLTDVLGVPSSTERFDGAIAYSLIYQLKLISFHHKAAALSSEEIEEIVHAKAWIATHPIPEGLQDPAMERQALECTLLFSFQLQRSLQSDKGQALLNKSLRSVLGGSDLKWDTSRFPLCVAHDVGFTSGRYFYNALEGTFYENGAKIAALPPSISQRADYAGIFDQCTTAARFTPPGIYTSLNGLMRLREKEHGLCVQRKLYGDGRWFEWIQPKSLPGSLMQPDSPLGTRELSDTSTYSHWLSLNTSGKIFGEREIMVVDKKSQSITHRILCEGICFRVKRIEKLQAEKPALQLANIYHQATGYSFLENIENKGYVHVWQKGDGQPALIELPRLGLNFTIEKHTDDGYRAHCTAIPGYYIAQEQRLRFLENFAHFLVLENSAGDKRKILIPRRPIEVLQEGALSCEIGLKQSRPYPEEFPVVDYLVYNVDKKGNVHCQDQEQSLFMAYLCLGKKQYAKAMTYLREHSRKLKSYSLQERQLLDWIQELHADNLDKDPKACAVYLCSAACLLKNEKQFGSARKSAPSEQLITKEREALSKKYLYDYLPVMAYTTALRLSSEEELLLLTFISNNAPEMRLALRMRELDAECDMPAFNKDKGQYRAFMEIPSASKIAAELFSPSEIANGLWALPNIYKEGIQCLKRTLEMAGKEEEQKEKALSAEDFPSQLLGLGNRFLNPPVEAIKRHFSQIYAAAKRKSTEVAIWLNILAKSPDVGMQGMRKLFLAVSHYPDLFPSWESLTAKGADPIKDLERAFEAILQRQRQAARQDDKKLPISLDMPKASAPLTATPVTKSGPLKPEPLCLKRLAACREIPLIPPEKLQALFAAQGDAQQVLAPKEQEALLSALSADPEMQRDAAAYFSQAPQCNYILREPLRAKKLGDAWASFIFKHESGLLGAAEKLRGIGSHALQTYPVEAEVKGILQNDDPVHPRHSPITLQALLVLLAHKDKKRFKAEYPVFTLRQLTLFKSLALKAFRQEMASISAGKIKARFCLDLQDPKQATTRLYRDLAIQATDLKKRALTTEFHLLGIANKTSQNAAGIARGVAEQATRASKITMSDLWLFFVQKDTAALAVLNPFLNIEDFNQLNLLVMHYLLQETRAQKVHRALTAFKEVDALKTVDGDNPERQAATNRLYAELEGLSQSKRTYNPATRPAFLLFEYCADLSLRREQVAKLEQMITPTGNPHVILQMIMGAGKTSVLLPILAVLNADGDHLSTVVVPEALFESVLKDMQETSRKAFKQATHVLYFDRNTQLTAQKLAEMQAELESIRQNKHYLLISSKSLACIALKYQEALYLHVHGLPSDQPLPELVEGLRKILLLFKEKGRAIIDEADMLLNCRSEVNFSIGLPQSLKEEHRTITATIFEQLLSLVHCQGRIDVFSRAKAPRVERSQMGQYQEIWTHLRSLNRGSFRAGQTHQFYLDSVLEQAMRQEMGKGAFPEGTSPVFSDMTESRYQANIKPRLTDKIVDLMKAHMGDRAESLIRNYLTNTHSKEQQTLLASSPHRHALALYRQQLNHILPLTLCKVCDTHYGFSEKSTHALAIPYSNGAPNETSQFGNPYELLNYTLLTYLNKGVEVKIIQAHVALLQNKALNELAQHPGIALEDTDAYRAFKQLCGALKMPPFLKCAATDLQAITQALNATRRLPGKENRLMAFVQTHVLPEVKIYPAKLSLNAQGLVDFFEQTQGFTGTPWNSDTFHEKITTLKDTGTDGKTMAILWQQGQGHCRQLVLKPELTDPQRLEIALAASVIASQNGHPDFRAIIDTGGIFKGLDNLAIAHALLKGLPESLKGIAFYQADKLVMLEKGKVCPIPFSQSSLRKEQRFTFYDQRHTTGSDIAQASQALAVATIGKDVTSRDLAQGIWRLRGLGKGQRIALVYLPAIAEILRQALPEGEFKESKEKSAKGNLEGLIGIQHILSLINHNQAKQKKEHCIAVSKQKIRHVAEEEMLSQLLRKSIRENPTDPLFGRGVSLLAKPVIDEPFATYGQMEEFLPKNQVIGQYIMGTLMAFLPRTEPGADRPKAAATAATQMAIKMQAVAKLGLLPSTLCAFSGEADNAEAEMEMQTEQQRQVEVVAEDVPAPIRRQQRKWDTGFFKKASYVDQWPFVEMEIERCKKIVQAQPWRTGVLGFGIETEAEEVVKKLCSLVDRRIQIRTEKYERAKSVYQHCMEEYLKIYPEEIQFSLDCIIPLFSMGAEIAHSFGLKDKFDPWLLRTLNCQSSFDKNCDKRLPLDYCLIIREKDGVNILKTVAITHQEASEFYASLEERFQRNKENEAGLKKQTEQEVDLFLYSKHMGVIHASHPELTPAVFKDPRLKMQMLQKDFLAGELSYSEEGEKLLHAWIGRDARAMEKFFLEHIIKNDTAKQKGYAHSSLKRIFDALLK